MNASYYNVDIEMIFFFEEYFFIFIHFSPKISLS